MLRMGRLLFPVACILLGAESAAQPQEEPGLVLDHIFLWVSPGAPEARLLQAAGLHTDEHIHQHTGEGTESMVFQFENAYLELIWIEDVEAAKNISKVAGFNSIERANWRLTGASPFGVGLHNTNPGSTAPPFPVTKYRAPWMQPDTFLLVSYDSLVPSTPVYIIVPDDMATPSAEQMERLIERYPDMNGWITHPLGVRKITGVTISLIDKLDATSRFLAESAILQPAIKGSAVENHLR